jgi:hypothetical protein
MDDFIYGEPLAASVVPEPATLWLLVTGFVAFVGAGRLRRNGRLENA